MGGPTEDPHGGINPLHPSSLQVKPEGIDLASSLQQSIRILNSYRHWFGADLIVRSGSVQDQARRLYYADQIVVSSGDEADPLFNYGNRQALLLWEMPWEQFRGMPARLSAEPVEQAARDAFLQRVRRRGFITDYQGIRISRTGRRFWISAATVWNILDDHGGYLGQAATCTRWRSLP